MMKLLKRAWRPVAAKIMAAAWENRRAFPVVFAGNGAALAFLLVGFVLIARDIGWADTHFSVAGFSVAFVVAALALFYVRRFFRLGYGFLEITVGLVIVLRAAPASDPTKLDELIIKLAAAVYLAIRGIDNCMHWFARKLPPGTPAWIRWTLRSE